MRDSKFIWPSIFFLFYGFVSLNKTRSNRMTSSTEWPMCWSSISCSGQYFCNLPLHWLSVCQMLGFLWKDESEIPKDKVRNYPAPLGGSPETHCNWNLEGCLRITEYNITTLTYWPPYSSWWDNLFTVFKRNSSTRRALRAGNTIIFFTRCTYETIKSEQ